MAGKFWRRTLTRSYIEGKLTGNELKNSAYLLKHSMRSDVYIIDKVYESALNEVAQGLGKVDDWTSKRNKESK